MERGGKKCSMWNKKTRRSGLTQILPGPESLGRVLGTAKIQNFWIMQVKTEKKMNTGQKKRHPAMPHESGFRLSAYRHPHKNGSISHFSGRCVCRLLQCTHKRQVSCRHLQVAIYPSSTHLLPFFALRLQQKCLLRPIHGAKTKAQGYRTMGSFSRYDEQDDG